MKKSSLVPRRCEILKTLRTSHKYTQEYVAQQVGVSKKTYRSWEIGEYKNNSQNYPSMDCDKLEMLASLYNVSTDYLLGRNECTTVENEKIHEITGLSDDAIETLKSLKIAYRFDEDMKIFNYIMSNRRLFSIFLSNLSDYIQPEYDVPIHPEQDEKTKNIKYVESVDSESNSISVNKERCIYVGKENGEFNGKPLYDIKSIPVSQLSTLNLLQIQEILQKWKDNYKKEMIDEII